MKTVLRHVPGLLVTYRHLQLLSAIVYERWWADRRRVNDRAILNGEWHFEAPAEQQRYRGVLAAVAALRDPASWGDVLEIGCAEGLFTRELVRQAASVTAYDVSPVACERTALALADVRVRCLDIEREPVSENFDLIFLMCVLGSLHGRRTLRRVSANLASALRPGGLLIFNELRFHDARMEGSWWARAFVEGGVQLLKFLDGRDGLRLMHHEMHAVHVIGIYEKKL
ncbi:MAG: class I SAM-dependent methyltransferase [Vicinamibacterales bacterium]